jgi:hypothetical protein
MKSDLSKKGIIDSYQLYFDADDKNNGSLYIGVPLDHDGQTSAVEPIVKKMRERAIWSETSLKSVPDEHRSAYKEQLELLDVRSYVDQNNVALIVARFDHQKFPSNADRWSDWLAFFDAQFA